MRRFATSRSGQRISNQEGISQRRYSSRLVQHLGQQLGHGRRQMRDSHLFSVHPGSHLAGLAELIRIGDADHCPELQRGEYVAVQWIMRDAGEHAKAIRLLQTEGCFQPGQEMCERPMPAGDPFGLPVEPEVKAI